MSVTVRCTRESEAKREAVAKLAAEFGDNCPTSNQLRVLCSDELLAAEMKRRIRRVAHGNVPSRVRVAVELATYTGHAQAKPAYVYPVAANVPCCRLPNVVELEGDGRHMCLSCDKLL